MASIVPISRPFFLGPFLRSHLLGPACTTTLWFLGIARVQPGPCIWLSLLEGLCLPVFPFDVMLYRSVLGRSIILLGEALLDLGAQVRGLGTAARMASACLAFHSGSC